MMIAIIALAIVLILLGLLWLLKTSGLFKPILINITQPPFDQITIMYKFHRGAYSKSGGAFRTLCKYSPLHLKLGIYYDDPQLVPVEERRFAVGLVVDETEDQDLIEQMQKDHYKMLQLPKTERSIYTTFPLINTLSIFIAIMRVPYRLGDYIRTNKLEAHPFIEIYDQSLAHYIVPLNNFDGYTVPEIINSTS